MRPPPLAHRRFACFKRSLLSACILASLPWLAHANCVLQPDGATVICDTSAPNPFTQSISTSLFAVGNLPISANGAHVILLPGAAMNTSGAAIQLFNNSTVLNQGTITTSLTNAYGMWAGDPSNANSTTAGYGNTLENDGSIVTTGANAVGMYERGANKTFSNTLINRGTIDTYGSIVGPSATASSAGIRSDSLSDTTIFNYGRVSAHGAYATLNIAGSTAIGGNGVSMGGPGTFTNETGASITSDNAYGFYVNGPNANGIALINAGAISGKLGAILFASGLSNNSVSLQAGSQINGSIDGGLNATNNSLIFDGLVNSNFSNAIPNWNLVAFRNGAAMGMTAPSYALSNVNIDAGSSASFNTQQIAITTSITNNGDLSFASANDQTIAAPISGTGNLTQVGPGALTLTAPSSYTGITTVAGGTLRAGAAQVFAPMSAFTVNAGATLDLASANQTIGSLAGAGLVTLGSGRLITGGLNTSTTFAGIISDSGSGSVKKLGTGTFTLTGNNTYTGTTVIANGALQLGEGGNSGSISGDVQDGANLTFDRSDVYTFNPLISDWTDTSPDPSGSVVQNGSGAIILNAINTYTGPTFVNAGTLAVGDATHASASLAGSSVVLVAPGATLSGYGSIAGDVDNRGTIAVANASALFNGQASGTLTVGGALANAALVQLAGSSVGNRLIVGDYFGKNASISINTVLDADQSPTDALVIQGGSATGQTVLMINNVGGTGALTTGNGIPVVIATQSGSTAAGAFSLGDVLEAGPYQYDLYRGSLDTSSSDSWYLRSQNPNPPPGISGPVTTVGPSTPGTPSTPGAGSSGSSGSSGSEPGAQTNRVVVPEYRPEVSLYTAIPSMTLLYGLAQVGNLHERLGELAQPMDATAGGDSRGWVRVLGQDGEWNGSPAGIYRDGPSFDNNFLALQAGFNVYSNVHDGGAVDRFDVLGTVGHDHGNVDNFDNTSAGRNNFDAYSLGGSWTHFGASMPWYLDAVVLATWYDTQANSNEQQNLSSNGFGTTASFEAGYPFALAQGWSLEPQSQVVWQDIHLDSAADNSASVRFRDVHELAARLGARASDSGSISGHPFSAWLTANVWHAFNANPQTQFSSELGEVPFHSDLSGSWWELGLGATTQLASHVAIYGQVGYEKGFNRGVRDIDATMGVRVGW